MEMESNLPNGWKLHKLGDICLINPSRREIVNLSDNMDVSFVPMSYVSAETGTIKTNESIKLGEVKVGYTYFREGDLLFAKITPCMENGKMAIAKNLINDIGFGSTEFHILRCSDKVLSEYLYHFLRQKKFRSHAKMNMTGTSGQLRVPSSFLENYLIPIPPISVQKKIVAKLDAFFKEYEILKREKESTVENYEKILQSAIVKMTKFSKIGDMTNIENLLNSKTIMEIKSGFASGQYTREGEYIHIRPMNINLKGNIDFTNCKYVKPTENQIEIYTLKKGDIIFNNTNSPELVGKTTIFDSDKKCLYSNHMTRIRVDSKKINPNYLAKYLHSIWRSGLFKRICRNHVSQASVNNTMLKELVINIPDISKQNEF